MIPLPEKKSELMSVTARFSLNTQCVLLQLICTLAIIFKREGSVWIARCQLHSDVVYFSPIILSVISGAVNEMVLLLLLLEDSGSSFMKQYF